MTKPSKIAIGICLATGIFFAGYMANRPPHSPRTQPQPLEGALSTPARCTAQYRSGHPGDAPCCGMRLEPVYAGHGAGGADSALTDAASTVRVSAGRQQLIGVQTVTVKRGPVSYPLRVTGRVTADDARLYRLVAASDGWIRTLGRYSPGTSVKENQILATYYVPNYVATMQAFLFALAASDQAQQGAPAAQRGSPGLNLQLAADSLRGIGMGERQIEEMQRARTASSEIQLVSPVSGFVVARNVAPGTALRQGHRDVPHRRHQPRLGDDRSLREGP